MPFEKTYAQRLRTLPPELRDSSIQYRELKQIIGRLVNELNDLGLSPETLLPVISRAETGDKKPISYMGIPADHHDLTLPTRRSEERIFTSTVRSTSEWNTGPQRGLHYSKILYELISQSGKFIPQLRVCVRPGTPSDTRPQTPTTDDKNLTESCNRVDELIPRIVRPASTLHPQIEVAETSDSHGNDREPTYTPDAAGPVPAALTERTKEFVIPLVHDAEFFNLLEGNIQTLTTQMEKFHSGFLVSLLDLRNMIADTCPPASVAANYHPYSSISAHAGTVDVKVKRMKSDLYAWREIFGLFVESEIFEHANGKAEWSIEESEHRLTTFADKVATRWLRGNTHKRLLNRRWKWGDTKDTKKFKHKQSAEALKIFIKLNFLILDVRKVFQANIDAIQKLVKKHTEHTALPISCSFSENTNAFSIGNQYESSSIPLSGLIRPRVFIHEIADKLFPIVPNQDDYSCVICTNIAFKPIRLRCKHLFCVRCLVKMQKRGEGNCPMCRAPTVLDANEANVDWGLLNFMEDWFPREAREKLKANEKEVVKEQLAEWRRNEKTCRLM